MERCPKHIVLYGRSYLKGEKHTLRVVYLLSGNYLGNRWNEKLPASLSCSTALFSFQECLKIKYPEKTSYLRLIYTWSYFLCVPGKISLQGCHCHVSPTHSLTHSVNVYCTYQARELGHCGDPGEFKFSSVEGAGTDPEELNILIVYVEMRGTDAH